MKKMIFVLLALVLVFAFASTAFAADGRTGNNETNGWNPPGPTYAGPMISGAQLRGGVAWASGNPSPHNSYSATTNKCEICHSPHQAGSGGTSYKLLYGSTSASGANDVCAACHVNQSYAIADVYTNASGTANGVYGGHDLGTMTNGVPDTTWATGSSVFGCTDCHTVHGAGMIAGFSILKAKPTFGASTFAGTATDMSSFCASCHDMNNDTTVNGDSHYMGSATAVGSTRGATALANTASTTCASCHAEPIATALTHVGSVKWPHQSSTIAGLGLGSSATSITSQANMDDQCLKCHGSGAGAMVGTNY